MEQKNRNNKTFGLMIAQIVLLMISFGLYVYSLAITQTAVSTDLSGAWKIISDLSYALVLCSGIAGVLYLAFGYGKRAALFYKLFMISLVISTAIAIVMALSGAIEMPLIMAIIYVLSLVAIVILASAKDLGKNKSYIWVGILLLCKLIMFIYGCIEYSAFSDIILEIQNILLVGTAALLVAGKYIDKAERGTK